MTETDVPTPLPRRHATRLRHYWRSAGWACHDTVDLDLMRWGLIEERPALHRVSLLVLTKAGRLTLESTLGDNRRARSLHAQAIHEVAEHLSETGRLVFTELAVHTQSDGRWQPCKPDVFSLVRGLRADHLSPQVHEIKVQRADLLGELRTGKIERYRELAAAMFFVIAEGIAGVDEIPPEYGVMSWRSGTGCRLLRPAPAGHFALETRHWMALAKARPFETIADARQLSF